MSPDSVRAPCVKCGNLLHTGEGRVIIAFTADELDELVLATTEHAVARRLLCALGLLDHERAGRVGKEREEAYDRADAKVRALVESRK